HHSTTVDFSKLGSLEEAIRKFEKDYIVKALDLNNNDKEKTSELLQVGLSTLYRKLKELEINI
ncbi:MAG: helix-turn-helix domain-containing protein, partial [Ignavibacteriaceae bacterium]